MLVTLIGTPSQFAGASGTVTLPAGAFVTHIVAHASAGGATLSILGGPNIPIVNGAPPLVLQFLDDAMQGNATNGSQIVFTGTDSYWVRAFQARH